MLERSDRHTFVSPVGVLPHARDPCIFNVAARAPRCSAYFPRPSRSFPAPGRADALATRPHGDCTAFCTAGVSMALPLLRRTTEDDARFVLTPKVRLSAAGREGPRRGADLHGRRTPGQLPQAGEQY